ncbi:hypothetical protein KM539_09015 [Xanthomonas translucens pv. poae]|uniref:hypothetical protein n=1 Tax=Xanthomonas graminis TaxID=3390026 RepID=UPI001112F9B5|nr:hypothetical protein [Xanthomonas translucens]UKE63554.1 hypothetical protein KM539_09015 [Xanthomonas translucens pv. poae]
MGNVFTLCLRIAWVCITLSQLPCTARIRFTEQVQHVRKTRQAVSCRFQSLFQRLSSVFIEYPHAHACVLNSASEASIKGGFGERR